MQYLINTRHSALNVRLGPGTRYRVIRSLPRGSLVDVVQSEGAWRKLRGGGWVHGDYLRPSTGAARPPDGEGRADGLILDHPKRPGNTHYKFLAGFDTGSARLKPRHQEWLSGFCASQARAGQYVWLRGLASRLGNRERNRQLSVRRAEAVRNFLVQACHVPAGRITGQSGVGEAWSQGDEFDNSASWRAVEVIVTSRIVPGDVISITGDSPVSTIFYIKYMGSGYGGLVAGLGYAQFAIRTSRNYWQRYSFAALGVSIGAPVSWGEALPPGRGWAQFSASARQVNAFDGGAGIGEIAATAYDPLGLSLVRMSLPDVPRDVRLQTGPGFSFGGGGQAGYLWTVGEIEHSQGWRRL